MSARSSFDEPKPWRKRMGGEPWGRECRLWRVERVREVEFTMRGMGVWVSGIVFFFFFVFCFAFLPGARFRERKREGEMDVVVSS